MLISIVDKLLVVELHLDSVEPLLEQHQASPHHLVEGLLVVCIQIHDVLKNTVSIFVVLNDIQ